ncbi:hypothetical protein EPO44_16820, partial [bacterium]
MTALAFSAPAGTRQSLRQEHRSEYKEGAVNSKLVILGGSSPFTVGLIDAIELAGSSIPGQELVLNGRHSENLALIQQYAAARLVPRGWSVKSTTNRQEALAAARVVIHQVRYGGMEGRAAAARAVSTYGVPVDESLGPAALWSILRIVSELQHMARELRESCPNAWVLNMTNPLSITTAVLAQEGLRCIGLCELPWVTVLHACQFLGLPPREVEWSYAGLNHRGFIYKLSFEGRDCLRDLANAIGQGSFGGITANDIRETNALPLKYFQLFRGGAPTEVGRTEFLSNLRKQLIEELRRSPTASPPSLSQRPVDWYPFSIVPFLAAITASNGRMEVVNVLATDGIAREVRARIFEDSVEPVSSPEPGEAVAHWLDVFVAHEHAVLAATLDPSFEHIKAALVADPLVPERTVASLAEAL